jgi:glycosyltransferase involved in cell wall biosynthesis
MSSQRILQVITRSDWGGAPRIVESLATQIEDVTGVACGPGGKLIDRLKNKDISVHVQPHLQSSPHPKDILAYRDLKQLVSKGEFDLVHAHSTKAGALTRIAASQSDIPSIFTVHGWGFYNTEYSLLRSLVIHGERYLEQQTNEIVCVSHNDRHQGQHHGILSAETGTVIHNGISPLEISESRNTLYEKFGIDQDTLIIGAIGRLAPQKNPLEILETSKKLQNRGHKIATVLIGSGPLQEECQQYINDNKMENTHLPGFMPDVVKLLPDFDIFLLPSRFEGFPLTVLECMHAGVPLVAHDVGGVAEAINHPKTGFVVSPDASEEMFVNHVEKLIESPDQRHGMAQRATKVATEQFTQDRMISDYQDIYQEIL